MRSQERKQKRAGVVREKYLGRGQSIETAKERETERMISK